MSVTGISPVQAGLSASFADMSQRPQTSHRVFHVNYSGKRLSISSGDAVITSVPF
jgi:hypothetical protein